MTRYTVTAERSGKWWSLQCVEFLGAISQVARLDQATDTIREAIAFVAEVPEESIEIDIEPIVSRPVRNALDAAAEARQEAARLNAHAASEVRRAAALLHDDHLTNREVAVILGVSHQRVNQLLKDSSGVQQASAKMSAAS